MVTLPRIVKHHYAFTLIELVFALVIIGLVAITIPSVLITNARQTETNLLQEAVLIATAKMNQNMAYRWDENSWDQVNTLHKTEAINVAAGDGNLNRVTFDYFYGNGDLNATDFRRGHFLEPLHRRMSPSSTAAARAATNINSEGGDYDDLDDISAAANTATINIAELVGALEGQGYKGNYTLSGVVSYVNDTPASGYNAPIITYNFPTGGGVTNAAGSTNIKMVEIRVDAANTPEPIDIMFRTYSCNIGETDYYKRTY